MWNIINSFEEYEKNDNIVKKTSGDNWNTLVYSKKVENDFDKRCNGVIYDHQGNVICRAQPKFNNGDASKDVVPENATIEFCEDGTVIRLYYLDGWRTATSRCMDAKDSYFSSIKSFDAMFWEVFDRQDAESLDKRCTFIFVLLHVENRMVVRYTKNRLLFVSSINNETGVECYTLPGVTYTVLEKLETIIDVEPNTPISDLLDRHAGNGSKKGIIVKVIKTEGERCFYDYTMYDFDMYTRVKKIRGNTPDISRRYVSLIKNYKKTLQLLAFYPEYRTTFSHINKALFSICKYTYDLYIDTHVKHKFTIGSNDKYFYVLKSYHRFFKTIQCPLQFEDAVTVFYKFPTHVFQDLLDAQTRRASDAFERSHEEHLL